MKYVPYVVVHILRLNNPPI